MINRTNTTTIGTAHFDRRSSALAFYRPYGFDAADVDAKLREGEIHIGEPVAKADEKIRLDVTGRYYLEF